MNSTDAPNSYLLEYIDAIEAGHIIVGHELKLMLDILVTHFSNPEIKVDFAEAHKRIRFIEEQCKHSEAPFAGKPFKLELFQKAFIESIYAFYIYDNEDAADWVRLYQEVLYLVGKKNGKTPLVSALCLAEYFCGEMGTKILCSSNDYTQADLAFTAINSMREESPSLERVTRKNMKGIYFGNPCRPKRKGKFSYQNKGEIRKISAKTNAREGRNIRVGVFDEVHELRDDIPIAPIRQGLSTQLSPLYFEITTEGFTDKGYLDTRLKEARQVLNDELYRPRWLVWLFTQDSQEEIWQNEESWVKSNPGLGVIKKRSYLRQMVAEAKTNSATRASVLAKDFNIKQSGGAAWLQEAEIINTATFDIAEFTGCWYIGGADFAETTDLCAFKMLFLKPGDPMVYLWSQYWIPELKLTDSPDDADYEQWAKEGYLKIVKRNSVDSSMVADWQHAMYEEYGVKPFRVGYDNRFAKDYVRRHDELFGEGLTINVPQDAKCLNNPMRRLETDLRGKLVNYNNRRGDFWCFRNTGILTDKIERIQPCKLETTKRIDGAAAALDCYAVLDWHKSEFVAKIGG